MVAPLLSHHLAVKPTPPDFAYLLLPSSCVHTLILPQGLLRGRSLFDLPDAKY